MSKKKNRSKTGRCVLCTELSDKLTSEHLLPKSWYPNWTPQNCYKQTFPSCVDCNKSHGQSEERLLRSIGLTLEETSVAGSGISQKVIHSMSMTEAPNEREAQIRGRLKLKFLNECMEIKPGETPDGLVLLPGLHVDPKTVAAGGYSVSRVSVSDIKNFAEKIVRGVTYLEYQLFIEDSQEIKVIPERQDFIEHFADNHAILPGLAISFGVLPTEDLPALVFVIRLWDKLTIYASCMPREDNTWKERVLRLVEAEPLWDIQSESYEKTAT